MNLRCLVALFVLLGLLGSSQFLGATPPPLARGGVGISAPTKTVGPPPGLTRQEIKQMPITERPNRVGHFYGNAVRRGGRAGG